MSLAIYACICNGPDQNLVRSLLPGRGMAMGMVSDAGACVQVPLDAIYRVRLALSPAWNSAVVDHRYKPAVHIFGVSPDTCPPGTFLKDAQRISSTPSTVKAANDSRLSDLYLIKQGGSVVELSTQFEPNTTLYGAMVSPVSALTVAAASATSASTTMCNRSETCNVTCTAYSDV